MTSPQKLSGLPSTTTSNQFQQDTQGDHNQTIGQIYGGIVVYVSGGQAIFQPPDILQSVDSQPSTSLKSLGANPYKGLLAFHESDGHLYFGRSREIQSLWERFRVLHQSPESPETIRFLPIYGPSGSGKSSLARAGLLPALGRNPLPGRDRARVAVMVPGTHPLQGLATVMARIVENDCTPVRKSREFAEELNIPDKSGDYNGLQRIASVLPDISTFPLIVLVDQFEETYSLCEDSEERDQFIANLLYAARDRSQYVSVIVTFRSDFLGETHKHLVLNQLFSKQGFLVPVMDEEALQEVIVQPAKEAGYILDTATVNLLIEETKGREGALPLLEFTLTRIWENLDKKEPAETLREIGGVGGALAREAQRIYCDLSSTERRIARRVFLGLVQLGEGAKDTRRRVELDKLITMQDEPGQLQSVIQKFASPGVRLITLSSNSEVETAEITHEALIDHWGQLREWLSGSRDNLRFQRKLEEAAQDWEQQGRPEGLLWRPPKLNLLVQYSESPENTLNVLQANFFQASKAYARRLNGLRLLIKSSLIGSLVLVTASGVFAFDQRRFSRRRQIENLATSSEALVSQHSAESLLYAVAAVGLQRLHMHFPFNLPVDRAEPLSLLHLALNHQELNLLKHDTPIHVVKFTPDSKKLITTSWDNALRIWDVETGELIGEPLHGAQSRIFALAISPLGNIMASAGMDGEVYLWDLENRQVIGNPIKGHTRAVFSLAFSPDGLILASASNDGTLRFWDVKTGSPIGLPIQDQDEGVRSIDFSPDGKSIISGGADGMVRHWNIATRELIYPPMKGHTDLIFSIAFSPDGSTIVSGSRDGTIQIWNAVNGEPSGTSLNYHEGHVRSVAFSPDGQTIISGSEDQTLRVWDVRTRRQLGQPLRAHIDGILSVAYSRDGRLMASGSWDETVRLWRNHRVPPVAQSLYGHAEGLLSVVFSPDDRLVASSSNDATLRIWDTVSGESKEIVLDDTLGIARSLAFSKDSQRLVSGHDMGFMATWNIHTGEIVETPKQVHDGRVRALTIHPSQPWIATSGGDDNTIRLWNLETAQPIGDPWSGHEDSIWSLAFSKDGNKLVSGSLDQTVRLWNVNSGQQIGQPFEGHTGDVYAVDISPDGQIIASGSEDKTIRLWSTVDNQALGNPLENHKDTISSLSFSPDGKTLVSGSYDRTIRFWSIPLGQPLGQPLRGHSYGVISVAFNNEGNMIASGSGDAALRFWVTDWEKLLTIACRELRYYPSFRDPEAGVARDAVRTCERYSLLDN